MGAVLALFVRMQTMPSHPLSRVTTGLMRQLAACTASLGVDNVLIGSPFGAVEGLYANVKDFTDTTLGMQDGFQIPVDLQAHQAVPDTMAWSDFGNFSLDDMQYDFIV